MPIELDLSELLHHPGMRQPYDVDVPCVPDLEMDCTSPVTGHLVFTNTGNVLVIQGQVSVELRTKCPRCLTDVQSRVEAPVDEEFTVEHELIKSRADDEEGEVDPTLKDLVRGGYILNVTELSRQSIVLSSFLEPLCREDCQGLCPQCGANWNETTCDCTPAVESPFAALASLYKDKQGPSTDEGQ